MNKLSQPLISVIVPIYNVSQYMDRCLASIISQTYINMEVILIDDGSKDNSGAKCDEWKEKDERITVVHKTNGGLSSARNVGLDLAKGSYVTFVDSDDIISPDLISVLHACIVKNDADIAICEAEHIFDISNFKFTIEQDTREFLPETAIVEMWYQSSFLPSAWGKLYKKALFDDRRFTLGRLFEDIDIMHEIFWKAKKLVYTTSRLYGYYHREESITTQQFSKRDLDILIIADKILNFAQDKSVEIMQAAESYTTVAALRVYLNAPSSDEFSAGIREAKRYLKKYGKRVIRDVNIRKKHRYALYLYFYCRPLIKSIYKNINRWK